MYIYVLCTCLPVYLILLCPCMSFKFTDIYSYCLAFAYSYLLMSTPIYL